ncbi:MAG: helix-turn-helix domain-containing protein [Clostridia bacterium]|nr:helix-turn-helix domain-containing protein [Clostridia bacterium]
MNTTATLIRQLRREKGMTQAQLADTIHVSAKAVSKWERGAGMPDASLVPSLSQALGVSTEALLAGCVLPNPPDGGNMKKIRFYRCPACGNLLTATGKPDVSCCGRRLSPLTLRPADEAHMLAITDVEDEKLVSWTHPMDKAHHLTFVAAIGYDCLHLVRLYPEGAQEHRLPRVPWARYVCGCSEEPDTLFISK